MAHRGDRKSRQSRTTNIPYKEWPIMSRVVERIYRVTHHGQIRTLVIGNPYDVGKTRRI